MTLPNVTRNLAEVEERLRAAAVLLVKAYSVPGEGIKDAAVEAGQVLNLAIWDYYTALLAANPELKGITYEEWRTRQGFNMPPTDEEPSPYIQALVQGLAQAAQVYVESKRASVSAANVPAGPGLDAVITYIREKDPELWVKINEMFTKASWDAEKGAFKDGEDGEEGDEGPDDEEKSG